MPFSLMDFRFSIILILKRVLYRVSRPCSLSHGAISWVLLAIPYTPSNVSVDLCQLELYML
jgi:hypothetical protein